MVASKTSGIEEITRDILEKRPAYAFFFTCIGLSEATISLVVFLFNLCVFTQVYVDNCFFPVFMVSQKKVIICVT
jgi:hypothetical protein